MYEKYEMNIVAFEVADVFTFNWTNSGSTSGTNSIPGSGSTVSDK